MKLAPTLSATALTIAFAGGLVSIPTYAAVPTGPKDIAVMDVNKNGKIEKEEYLSYMGKQFDQTAGSRGFCTLAEVSQGGRKLGMALELPNQ